MPYIDNDKRMILDSGAFDPASAGELNYCFTQLILDYMETKGKSYQTVNDIVGALEGAKLEFYRRVAVPYEDKKIKENGDVYND